MSCGVDLEPGNAERREAALVEPAISRLPVRHDGTVEPRRRDLRPWFVAAAVLCVVGVLAIRLWLKWVGPIPGDRWAQWQVTYRDLDTPWRDLGVFFSVIGTPTIAIPTGCIAAWFVWRGAGWRAVAFVVIAGTGVFANMVLKVLSGPTPLLIEKWGNPDPGLNYPSGHTVYGVVMFGSLAWIAWAHHRRDISAVLISLVALMGPFRVIADAHFVSDVIAGYLAGAAWLLTAALLTGAGGTAPSLSVWTRAATRAGAPAVETPTGRSTP